MTTDLKSILNNHLPIDSPNKTSFKQPPIGAVDRIADDLVTEYKNPDYRRWYCGVIYEFGPAQVHEWKRRASEGKEPAKLFSKYVKDSRTYKGSRSNPNE